MCLSELNRNTEAVVKNLSGDQRFISRITSIGLTPGCSVKVIRNDKNRPMLVYSRDTMIALNRKECMGIEVAEVTA
ncbi:MAG: ferrous iron transport protein A [Butyrivibrio sp.]|uniref:FeoA family protein n=1 Tax=Butyrivibrio sp. TaxID=28121 RepID=UPI001B7A8147|nr:FeoA family protein [Butyrivibrio sp.]MBP3274802.1 ferrous iron transport protein A [Butyrivibrio sp.]MBP3279449.1 ferrous iron transport protein A [Butyrivibrio sp.]MBP3782462.1 ferrous iron transport protein A [Butyrivibrio sp.]MBP3813234.1 ferrous iron transport protein A [Butyrivibrio sp.]